MGNIEAHDFAPVRDDERKELNLSRKVTFKSFCKHIRGEMHEACLTELPWSIRDSVSLYERMNVSFNALTEIPPEIPLRLPHLSHLDLSYNHLTALPESFGLLFHLRTLLLQHNKLMSLPESFTHHVKLEKVDLSHNLLRELPDNMGHMESLRKLNITHNKLKALPASLGGAKFLSVLLAAGNRCASPPQTVCDEGSTQTLAALRKLYRVALETGEKTRPLLLEFPRVRCNQLQTPVSNPHALHMQYIQEQTETTNTPHRIKIPLSPPPGATRLDPFTLRDRIVGMIYGAAIGDAIGIATRWMTRDECDFYYEASGLAYSEVVQDIYRVRWRQGDWTSNFDLFMLVMDSLLHWGGVVDELDFAKRLQLWSQQGYKELGDSEGFILSETMDRAVEETLTELVNAHHFETYTYDVLKEEIFIKDPHSAARRVLAAAHSDISENGSVAPGMEGNGIASPCASAPLSPTSPGSGNPNPLSFPWRQTSMSDSDAESCASSSSQTTNQSSARNRSTSNSSDAPPCAIFGTDNGAIVRAAILGVPSFHNLDEVEANLERICIATHADPRCLVSSLAVTLLVSLMLQGQFDVATEDGLAEMVESVSERCVHRLPKDMQMEFITYINSRNLDGLKKKDDFNASYTYKPLHAGMVGLQALNSSFQEVMMQVALLAGDSNSNCCVMGALMGCRLGFSRLPQPWVENLRKRQTRWLNAKINQLLDMMGLP